MKWTARIVSLFVALAATTLPLFLTGLFNYGPNGTAMVLFSYLAFIAESTAIVFVAIPGFVWLDRTDRTGSGFLLAALVAAVVGLIVVVLLARNTGTTGWALARFALAGFCVAMFGAAIYWLSNHMFFRGAGSIGEGG